MLARLFSDDDIELATAEVSTDTDILLMLRSNCGIGDEPWTLAFWSATPGRVKLKCTSGDITLWADLEDPLAAAAPDLLAACETAGRELDCVATKLAAAERPGHVDYLSKKDAASVIAFVGRDLHATIARATGQNTETKGL